jgi:glutathione S-transferase
MKLFYAPGACSIGIHVLLEEIGKPYEGVAVNLREGAHFKPDFTAVNPKSKVPTVVDDEGTVRTEFPAIAYWLARTNPYANLLPDNIDLQARVLELMDYCVATIHMQGFARIFRAPNFSPSASDEPAVKARGTEIAEKGFATLNAALEGKDYAVGPFSIADSALFYVEYWAGRVGIALPPNCAAHLARMLARPAVQRTLKAEGLA